MRPKKKVWLAALLNLIPLVGIGLLAYFARPFPVAIPSPVRELLAAIPNPLLVGLTLACSVTTILWGFGYRYLGRLVRFVVALCVPYIWCAGYVAFPKPFSNQPDFYFPYLREAVLVLGVLNLVSGIDAWVLASRQGLHDQGKDPRQEQTNRT